MQKQQVAGIVCEYNPFHKGHEWMISQLRRGGVGAVVCVMSGPFVQRAEPALLPTPVRAKAALAGGADLVLRLPVHWAAASAEGFATGAVGLLSALGCVDLLAFGAETPNIEALSEIAALLLDAPFSGALKAELAEGLPFAAARAAAAERLRPGAKEILGTPNNILAIEYCKALLGPLPGALRALVPSELRGQMVSGLYGNSLEEGHLFPLPVPLALPRVGAAHDGGPDDGFASAGWLRERALPPGGSMQALAPWVPDACLPYYLEAEEEGAVISPDRWELALLARLRGRSAMELGYYPGAGEGLEARLAVAARRAVSMEELYTLAKSKRFAHSRVRRLALAAALGLPRELPLIPPFAQVLAANSRGIALLRSIKEKSLIPVGTSLAKLAKHNDDAGATADLEAGAEDVYALCQRIPSHGGLAFTSAAAIVGFARRNAHAGDSHNGSTQAGDSHTGNGAHAAHSVSSTRSGRSRRT